jgi:cardiolipin synthase
LADYAAHLGTLSGLLHLVVIAIFVPWVLMSKKDSTTAVAWCLVVVLLPLLGALLFWVFGYTHIARPLRRVRAQRSAYRARHPPRTQGAARGEDKDLDTWNGLGTIAREVQAFPISEGNAVHFYHDTHDAFAALVEAIRQARHHVHLEFFIFNSDSTADALVGLLAEKARQGVEVRLLYDAMGSVHLRQRTLRPLLKAGGQASAFLPLNPLRSRIQVNLRNHRKIVVLDGQVAFTGGMNIGDEYLGLSPSFAYWRDSFLRLEGPAVAGFQRIFTEDWDFAVGQPLDRDDHFPDLPQAGDAVVQVVESGPDQEVKSIREVLFAAIVAARQRVWIATPYFIPDSGLLDALRLARYRGVDVRLLTMLQPDHWLAYFAARYYWAALLECGLEVYQYRKGMMHAKFLTVDGSWGMIGSANLDNRSLHLAFEAALFLHTPGLVAQLDEQFGRDMEDSIPVDPELFGERSWLAHLLENGCRLLSPLL